MSSNTLRRCRNICHRQPNPPLTSYPAGFTQSVSRRPFSCLPVSFYHPEFDRRSLVCGGEHGGLCFTSLLKLTPRKHVTLAILAEGRTSLAVLAPAGLACILFVQEAVSASLFITIFLSRRYLAIRNNHWANTSTRRCPPVSPEAFPSCSCSYTYRSRSNHTN